MSHLWASSGWIQCFPERRWRMCDMICLARAAHDAAKSWFSRRAFFRWGTLLLGVAAVALPRFSHPSLSKAAIAKWELVLAAAVLATEVAGVVCALYGDHLHSLAREGMRKAVLLDAFGKTAESIELSYLRQRFGSAIAGRARSMRKDEPYYYSTLPHGVGRLVENLQESAFYSSHLFFSAAKRSLVLFVVPSAAILVLSLLLPLVAEPLGFTIARTLVAMMLFFAASESLAEAGAFLRAARSARDTDRRLEGLGDASQEVILAAFADYSAMSSAAPPIPGSVYAAHRERLRKEWEDRTRRKGVVATMQPGDGGAKVEHLSGGEKVKHPQI